jgi:transcriptional regulator with XRE-family HTH domain
MKRTKRAFEFVVAVGANVRRERERLGLSQSALGGKLNATHSAVSRIESGERDIRISDLFEVGRALNVAPAKLVTVEPPKTAQ